MVESRFYDVGSVRLHGMEAGEGPLVVLLHGFPEFWYSWRHQIPVLAEAGYRVVAPDLRGYNLSDKPAGLGAYRVRELAADVAGLVRACGAQQATVVGHDWGGAVAWGVALRHPEVVERLVILNSPHPIRFLAKLREPRQALRSWYMGLFQLPWLPELLLRAGGYRGLRRTLRRWGGESFSEEDIARYVEAYSQPGALTGPLNYYRAMRLRQRRDVPESGGVPPVEVPVMVIWGDRDPVLGADLADPGERFAPNRRIEHIGQASHFVQSDTPDRVNELLLDFLRD